MDSSQPEPKVNRDTPALKKHRREVMWQVLLPLVLGIVLVLVLMGVSVFVTTNQSLWADISLIWLIIPLLPLALVTTAILAGLSYGVVKLIHLLPRYTQQTQDIFRLIRMRVGEVDDRLVAPVIKINSTTARFQKLMDQFRRR